MPKIERSKGLDLANRLREVAAVTLATLALAAAYAATPEEDYKRGEQAYLTGDVMGAMSALRRAADQGHAPAQALLGEILDRAELDEEAVVYYRKAAEQGYAPGETSLGTMYLAGEGVPKDFRQAVFWLTKAAEREYGPAIVELAQALMDASSTGEGAAAEAATVLHWVRKSADLGYLPAVERLASAYAAGELGLSPDAMQAQAWAAKAQELRKKKAGTPVRRRR